MKIKMKRNDFLPIEAFEDDSCPSNKSQLVSKSTHVRDGSDDGSGVTVHTC